MYKVAFEDAAGERITNEFTFRGEAVAFAQAVSRGGRDFSGWTLSRRTDSGRWSRLKLPLMGPAPSVRYRVIDPEGEELAVVHVYPTGWRIGNQWGECVSLADGLRIVASMVPAGRIRPVCGDRTI